MDTTQRIDHTEEFENKTLTCRQCGKEFVFTSGEQEFYELKGFNPPSRCSECRPPKSNHHQSLVCSQCKNTIEKDASIYCKACLASVHLEYELQLKQREKAADEALARLQFVESRKSDLEKSADEMQSKIQLADTHKVELEKSLNQKENLVAELEKKVRSIGGELEKGRQFQVDLQEIGPALDGIKSKLDDVEREQYKINQRMLQMMEKIHEYHESTSMMEIIKRSFRRSVGEA